MDCLNSTCRCQNMYQLLYRIKNDLLADFVCFQEDGRTWLVVSIIKKIIIIDTSFQNKSLNLQESTSNLIHCSGIKKNSNNFNNVILSSQIYYSYYRKNFRHFCYIIILYVTIHGDIPHTKTRDKKKNYEQNTKRMILIFSKILCLANFRNKILNICNK